jgi:virulence-associated protein VagC
MGLICLRVYIMVYIMKTAKLFKTGRSRAVRLPKEWIEGVEEVTLEQTEGEIIIRPKNVDIWQVAEACDDGYGFPDRLPQSESGVRFPQ